ncbi:integrin alpha-IIb [Bombina bombina]|uniref:integrin alpha-IIb n=1 Tax=Bombina bombina TaxID=8345 RepID=UPI00235AE164|nr:integrin alpha-IIb [Bombina bombina]
MATRHENKLKKRMCWRSEICSLILGWCCLLLLPMIAQALNLDAENPKVIPGPNGSYFGFSLDFHQDKKEGMNILVGAPKLQTTQPGVNKSGGVFLCPWSTKTPNCNSVAFDNLGDETFYENDVHMKIFKSNQWFGATVRSWKSNIVACAPFQSWNITDSITGQESGVTPTGSCYVTGNLKDFHEFAPCRDVKTEPSLLSSSYMYDKRFCEIGFSAEVTKDGTLLVGAPGGYFLSGLISTVKLSFILNDYNGRQALKKYTSEQISLDTSGSDSAYTGFSVAIGEFTDDSTPEFVVGSPNFFKTEGIVTIHRNFELTRSIYSFKGQQVASYFGYSVAVADINNDRMDDVLVGAPLFIERRSGGKLQEVGRVFIYKQKRRTRFHPEPQILSGTKLYGQFGSSIASLGDLDQDGFNDVAVGAPFGGKTGSGCVYIYRGGNSGLSAQPSQVLEPTLPPNSRFGFALRGGMDIDDNGYPDLLVGAFEADKAYIFRAQPVVFLHTSIHFTPDTLNPDVKGCQLPGTTTKVSCFIVSVCVRASEQSLPRILNLSAELQLDRLKSLFSRRTFFLESSQPSKILTIKLQSNMESICQNKTAYLRSESEFKDKLSSIVVSVNVSLVRSQSSDVLEPTLQGITFLQEQTNILLDCGEDNVCIPDLHLSVRPPEDPLLIGIDNSMQVQFNATNSGEGAYEAELFVQLPPGAHYVHVKGKSEEKILCSPKLENKTETVVCELGNPMKNKALICAYLQLSFSNLEDSGSNITFQMQIRSRNSLNSSSSVIYVQLAVAVKASLDLRGSSQPAEVVLPIPNWEPKDDTKKPQDYGKEVTHVYEIHNAGPSSVQVLLIVQSPTIFQDDFFLYPLRLEADNDMFCGNESGLNPWELELPVVTPAPVNHSKADNRRLDKRETGVADEWTEENLHNGSKTEDGALEKPPILLNCSKALCWEVQCVIPRLDREKRATVKLHSILMISSFLKRPQQQFTLLSQGSFQVTGVPYKIKPTSLLEGMAHAETQVLWVSPDGQKPIPIWWLIVGILGGVLLLILFIFIMWKLGFFQRTRPPLDDQEELTSQQ